MRRNWAWLLIAALVLQLLPGLALAEEMTERRNAVTVDGDTAYLLEDGVLWTLDEALAPKEQVRQFEEDVRDVCAVDGAMYCAWRADGEIHFSQLDGDSLKELFSVKGEEDVRDFLVIDGRVIVIWGATEADYEQLPYGSYRASAYALDGKPMQFDFDNLVSMAACGAHELLVSTNQDYMNLIYVVNLETGERRQLMKDEYFSDVYGLAAVGELKYFIDYSGLSVIENDEKRSNVYMSRKGNAPLLAVRGEEVIAFEPDVWDGGPSILFSYDPAKVADATPLYVVINGNTGFLDDHMNRTVELLREEYPDVVVKFVDYEQEQLNTILLAGDEGADVLVSGAGWMSDLISAGGLVDLKEDPVIVDELKRLNNAERLATYDGVLYGVPAWVLASSFYFTEALEAYVPQGFDVNDCSWAEFLNTALAFDGDTDGDGKPNLWFLAEYPKRPLWMRQYISSYDSLDEVDFDTPLFRQTLELYREALNAGKIVDSFGEEYSWGCALYEAHDLEAPGYGDPLIPLPTLDGTAVRIGQATSFAVNSRSANRDVALRFLEIYISPEAMVDEYGNVLIRIPVSDEEMMADTLQNWSTEERQRYDAEMEYFSQLVPDLDSSDFISVTFPLLEQYYAEEITTDEFIQQLKQGLDMRRRG